MPKAKSSSSNTPDSSTALNPRTYRALKTEQGVFTTPPYSGDLKGLWKFKDAEAARESSAALWERFVMFRDQADFVGMDVTRKFIQMGRTRSLRYALRKGGRKYEMAEKGKGKAKTTDDHDGHEGEEGSERETRAGRKEIPRTGEVYDESKLEGASVFEGYLDRCWRDEVYARAWEDWREAGKRATPKASSDKTDRKAKSSRRRASCTDRMS